MPGAPEAGRRWIMHRDKNLKTGDWNYLKSSLVYFSKLPRKAPQSVSWLTLTTSC